MKKPHPKKEITVRVLFEGHLEILTFSGDSQRFIEKEAGRFGNLYPNTSPIRITHPGVNCYSLYIYEEAYNIEEVRAYLEAGK